MESKNIRNIALLGHGNSGKTSLTESMLFVTGAVDRLGKVSDGNTGCDYDAEEIKRQITISSSLALISFADCKVNVLFREPEKYTGLPEGAESLEELFARTGEFLREKADPLLAEGKDVLIVGHGAMNSSIVCQRKGLPVSQFWSAGIESCRLMELP